MKKARKSVAGSSSQRRLGTETAKNRALLIDTAQQLLCQEGYVAITARRVAERAGLTLPLVYYYFETMDDLILEVVRKSAATRMKRFVQALASPEPFRALWDLNRDPSHAVLSTEMIAIANHREKIRTEAVAAARQFRSLQIEAVDLFMTAKGLDKGKRSPGAIVILLTALTRAMAQDSALGVTEGYNEALALVEREIESFASTLP